MKLAEALALRSDLQKRLAQTEHEMADAARYQEGNEPPEPAADLLDRAHGIIRDLAALIRNINRTNSATRLDGDGPTLTEAIAERDALGQHRNLAVRAAQSAATDGYMFRRTRTELRMVTDLPVAQLRQQADAYARQRRELDVKIQQANWATDLLDG